MGILVLIDIVAVHGSIYIHDAEVVFLNIEDLALVDLVIEWDIGFGLRGWRDVDLQVLGAKVARVLFLDGVILMDNG